MLNKLDHFLTVQSAHISPVLKCGDIQDSTMQALLLQKTFPHIIGLLLWQASVNADEPTEVYKLDNAICQLCSCTVMIHCNLPCV